MLAVLAYIEDSLRESRRPPTVREIGDACGITSTSVVDYNLNRLVQLGYLARDRGSTRGLYPTSGHICECCGGSGRIQESAS